MSPAFYRMGAVSAGGTNRGGEIRKVYETGDLFDTKYESVSNGKTVQKLGGSHGLAGLCVETHVLKVVSSNPSTV